MFSLKTKITCKIYPNIQYDRQCTYKCSTVARSCNHCCHGKALNITYSECVSVALVIQHAKQTGCIILSSVVCPALSYFSTLSHKLHNFQVKLLNIKWMFLFSLQILSETFHILRSEWVRCYHKFTLCSTKIKWPDISYVPLRQWRDVQLPS